MRLLRGAWFLAGARARQAVALRKMLPAAPAGRAEAPGGRRRSVIQRWKCPPAAGERSVRARPGASRNFREAPGSSRRELGRQAAPKQHHGAGWVGQKIDEPTKGRSGETTLAPRREPGCGTECFTRLRRASLLEKRLSRVLLTDF